MTTFSNDMKLGNIALVLSDVDGTLVTPQKEITPAAREAIDALRARGIRFAIASSRPARGLRFISEELELDTPASGFNGGRILAPDGAVIENMELPGNSAAGIAALLAEMQLPVWLFAGDDWYLTDPAGERVDHEIHSIRYDPIVVPSLTDDILARAVKLVAVSMDYDLVHRAEEAVNARFGDAVSATRSQPFYLDITHIDATKGAVVHRLARHYGLDPQQIATIGDGENDILMFRESGWSFAMANGSDSVKNEASEVTASNREDGFAKAMAKIIGAHDG